MVLSEQRDLFGEFVYLHQILFEKVVNSCVILLSCLVLRQIAEPVAVVEVQPVQTAHLGNFVAPVCEPVLLRSAGLGLERLEVDAVPVLNEPLGNSILGILIAEAVEPDGTLVALALDRPVFPLRVATEGIAHLGQAVFKLLEVVAHRYGFIKSGTGEIISCRHTGLVLHRQVLCIVITLRLLDGADPVLLADTVGFLVELEPRGFPAAFTVHKGHGVDDEVAVQMLGVQVGRDKHLMPFAPNGIGKLHPDMLRQLRRDVGFLEAEIAVVGLDAVRLVELLLDRNELLTGG